MYTHNRRGGNGAQRAATAEPCVASEAVYSTRAQATRSLLGRSNGLRVSAIGLGEKRGSVTGPVQLVWHVVCGMLALGATTPLAMLRR